MFANTCLRVDNTILWCETGVQTDLVYDTHVIIDLLGEAPALRGLLYLQESGMKQCTQRVIP